MERKVGLVVDSTFGLSESFLKENNIGLASLNVMIGDQNILMVNLILHLLLKHFKKGLKSKQVNLHRICLLKHIKNN
ncbi:DegV family protein [Mycoplasmatota bacterium]|nr:DegV family protein [Mycoplasmatota bacterium]